MNVRDIQQALATLGHYKGVIDGISGPLTLAAIKIFQNTSGISVDGIAGPVTQSLLRRALNDLAQPPKSAPAPAGPVYRMLEPDWLPNAVMKGVVFHWTAGTNDFSAADREHYHFAIDGNAKVHRGRHAVSDNDARGMAADYAAHTRNCNTGFVGVSLCGMRQAVERPFNAGPNPIRLIQWVTLVAVIAELCARYGIAVTPRTVLSHAEVQGTLGITQAGKWDIARLPFDPSLTTAKAVGDRLRGEVSSYLKNLGSP